MQLRTCCCKSKDYKFDSATSSVGYSGSDILRELRELHDLKQMGVLTEEEFADKKKVLLTDLK